MVSRIVYAWYYGTCPAELDVDHIDNDPVIKEILRLGYIPTDVSGTLTNVDSKVLPDIDCKIKCK